MKSSWIPTFHHQRWLSIFLLAIAVLTSILILNSHGTGDVASYWLRWMTLIREYGLVGAYSEARPDYPPAAFVLLRLVVAVANSTGLSDFMSLKATLAVFTFMLAVGFGLWTRSLLNVSLIVFAMMLSSLGLGYLDILFALPLFGAFVLLDRRRPVGAAAFFFFACMVKWQPIIIAPFFCLSLARVSGFPSSLKSWRALVLGSVPLAVGAAIAVVPFVLYFGWASIFSAFMLASTGHPGLSYNTLNLNWIIQGYLAVKSGVVGAYYGYVPDKQLVTCMKLVFFGFFLVAVWLQTRSPKFGNFLRCSLLGYLSYVMFNTGVHENHLFLSMLLGLCLLVERGEEVKFIAVALTVMSNVNLFFFYGVQGRWGEPPFNGLGLSVAFSLIHVGLFAVVFLVVVRDNLPFLKRAR